MIFFIAFQAEFIIKYACVEEIVQNIRAAVVLAFLFVGLFISVLLVVVSIRKKLLNIVYFLILINLLMSLYPFVDINFSEEFVAGTDEFIDKYSIRNRRE